MKVFAANYLESMTEDFDISNEWSWKPANINTFVASRKPTKSLIMTHNPKCVDQAPDKDQPKDPLGIMVA